MWDVLLKAALSAGAVWAIAVLSAKVARKSAELEQVKKEDLEREKVDKAVKRAAGLSRAELLKRLHDNKDK